MSSRATTILTFLVISAAAGASAGSGAPSRAAGKPRPTGEPTSEPVTGPHAQPQDKDRESASERRAVRGSAVDESLESPELSELRQFEEQTFSRSGGTASVRDTDAPEEAPPELPGRWEGSGDVPEVLRSPERGATPGAGSAASRAPALPDSEWLRSLKLPELPVRWDPTVLHYLEFFRSHPRGHAIMGTWLRRAGRFRGLIEATLDKEGLPKDLLYLAMVESGFDTGARSRVGAGGIWQFMPGAARAYGLEVGYWLDARRDPERSVEAAARYLKDLYVRFGSWHLVFAAYNAGYGAVLQSITRYNTNDYWELCRHEAGLPWESSLYVPKILAAAIVGHNPEAFGFGDLVPDPPFAFERVDVPGGTSLATVARAIAARPEALAALNPQLARDRAPPDRPTYSLRLPVGSRELYAESFERDRAAGGRSGDGDRLDMVTLRFGETLESLARARGTSVRELRRLNGVKDGSELRAGVALLVPRRREASREGGGARDGTAVGPATATAGGEAANVGAGAGAAGSDDDEILVAIPDRVFNYEGRERVFYRTRDADTLEEIGEVFGVRVDDLVEWNNLDATAKIHPRMVLQIFVRKDFDPRNVVLLDPAQVRVVTLGSREFLELEAARRGKKRLVVEARAGDTLAKVGRRYGLTVGDLARINRFSSSTDLQGGQQIVVYSPTGGPLREVARGMAIDPRRQRDGEHDRVAGAKVSTTVSARPASTPAPRPPLAPAPAGAKWTAKGSAQGMNRAEAPTRAKLPSLRQPTERKLAEVRPVPDKPGTSARPKASGGASGSGAAIGGKGPRPGEKPKAPVRKADGSKTDARSRNAPPAAPGAIGSPGKGVSRKPR